MPTVLSEGTFDPADNNPVTVYSSAANKHFSFYIDLDEMDTGDTLVVIVKVKVLTGDTFKGVYKRTFNGPNGGQEADDPNFFINYLPGPYGIELSLAQTAGTLRDYKWQANEP